MREALPKSELRQYFSRFCLHPKLFLQVAANLVTFAEEVLYGKLHFLCSAGHGLEFCYS